MKKAKKSLCVVLCVIFFVMTFLAETSYAVDSDVYYDLESGVLYIGGSGSMTASYSGDASIEEVYIERGITSVPAGAFSGCANLRRAVISNSVEAIGAGAFENCASLNEIQLSRNISVIPEYLFSGCTSLTGVKIPDSVESIDCGAFNNCTALRFVIIPHYADSIASDAFAGCSALSGIYYAGSEAEWENIEFAGAESGSVSFLAPEFYTEKTYSSGKMVLSLKLGSGSFNALDAQLAPQGECSIYRIQVNKSLTSSSNRNSGMISMYSESSPEPDDEIVKITYNISDCENSAVNISFLSCTVRVEGIDVDVPIESENRLIQGSHSVDGEWTVISAPSADSDGMAEGVCVCCGQAFKNLPYAFKNCTEENGIIYISSYGLDSAAFAEEYLTSDLPSVAALGEYVGTDTGVTVDYSDGIIYNYSVSLKGDVDGDGFCDAQDSILMACVCEEMLFEDDFSPCAVSAMNIIDRKFIENVIDFYDVQIAEFNGIQKFNLS